MNNFRRGRGGRGGFLSRAEDTARERAMEARLLQRIKNVAHGQRFRPPVVPPQFSSNPWNPLTLVLRGSADGSLRTYTVDAIQKAVVSQISIKSPTPTAVTPVLDLRFIKIMSWAISDSAFAQLRIIPGTMIDKAAEQINLDSTAQKNMYAAIGYTWPASTQVIAKSSSTDGTDIVLGIMATKTAKFEIHLHVLWKGAVDVNITETFGYEYDGEFVSIGGASNSCLSSSNDIPPLTALVERLTHLENVLIIDDDDCDYDRLTDVALSRRLKLRDKSKEDKHI